MLQVQDHEIIEAITINRGMIMLAAQSLKCSPSTIYDRLKTSEAVKEALSVARERTLDMAELVLFDKAMAGEAWAVCFLLKTQGRSRGYIERQEVAGVKGEPIEIKVVYE